MCTCARRGRTETFRRRLLSAVRDGEREQRRGSAAADRRLARVLHNDPATGVMRHADAGYEIALDCAREKGLNLPGILD